MRILVIGANGQVGYELTRALAPLGEVLATTRKGQLEDGGAGLACDLAIPNAAVEVVKASAPDIVVNAAAYTAVDKAEAEPALARRINSEALSELAGACSVRGVPLIHYSTDYVFNGQGNQPYQPGDGTAPMGEYGASKLAGEAAIRASGVKHLILRTAWVYGFHGHNFLKTMLRVGAERDELRVVADQIGSPTPAWMIADVTAEILRKGVGAGGTHHLVTNGETSWHGFAEAIFAEAVSRKRIQRPPVVHAISTSEYPTPARRPAYSVLDTTSLRTQYDIVLPGWQDALSETFARHTTNN